MCSRIVITQHDAKVLGVMVYIYQDSCNCGQGLWTRNFIANFMTTITLLLKLSCEFHNLHRYRPSCKYTKYLKVPCVWSRQDLVCMDHKYPDLKTNSKYFTSCTETTLWRPVSSKVFAGVGTYITSDDNVHIYLYCVLGLLYKTILDIGNDILTQPKTVSYFNFILKLVKRCENDIHTSMSVW
jgi:hypothetical protein